MRQRFALSLLVAALACGPASGGVRTSPPRPQTPTATLDSLAGPWVIRNAGRPRAQVITLYAVLRSQVDTLLREDTLASETVLEWSAVPDVAPPRAVGMVRAFRVRLGADTAWRTLAEPSMPVSFAATADGPGTQPMFTLPVNDPCSPRAAVVQAFRETWVAPPSRLARGTAWQDSATYPLCRDGVVLHVTALRAFTVDTAVIREGRLTLRVRRETVTTLTGRGVQFGDSVHVTGSGSATATLDLSLDGGAIVAGEGRSELRLQLQGRRRTQQLVQHGALTLHLP